MPIDVQILAAGQGAAPVSYTVPNAQEILLKAVNANFDGSGAGGNFIPAVVIESDGGVVIARAADPSVVVTAGNDAEVSWFPGVTNAAAAPPGGSTPVLAWGHSGLGQNVNGNSFDWASFTSVRTSDNTQLAWSTTTNPNDTLTVVGTGTLLCLFSMFWTGGANDDGFIYSTSGNEMLAHNGWFTNAISAQVPFPGFSTHMDQSWLDCSSNGTTVRVKLVNGNGFLDGPQRFDMSAILFPGVFA